MNQSTQSYIRFLGKNEPAAFDLYIEVHREFAERQIKLQESSSDRLPSTDPGSKGLIDTFAMIRNRLAMYLGNEYSTESLLTLCNGFFEGERTIGVTTSPYVPLVGSRNG